MKELEQKLVELLDKVDESVSQNAPELTQEYVQYLVTHASHTITAVWVAVGLVTMVILLNGVVLASAIRKRMEEVAMGSGVVMAIAIFVGAIVAMVALTTLPSEYAILKEPVGYAVDKALN